MKTFALHLFAFRTGKVITFSDQIVVTGSNFLLAILITKSCGIGAFGSFASAWLWILFMSSLQQAFILMPMITLYYKNLTEDYLNRVGKLQALFSIASIGFIILASLIYNGLFHSKWMISETFILIALISGFFLWNEYVRKRYFLLKTPKKAFLLDVVVYVLPIFFLLVFPYYFNQLNRILYLLLCFYLIGFSFNFSLIFYQSKYRSLTLLFYRHWRTGYYLVLSSLLQWFAGNSFLVVGSTLLATEEFGAIRIGQSIIGICTVFFQFLENSTPIDFGNYFRQNGKKGFLTFAGKHFVKNGVFLAIFLISIVVFKTQLLAMLFNDYSLKTEQIIDFLCFLQLFVLLGMFVRFYLRTIENNKIIFLGYLIATIISVSSSKFLVANYGQFGVIIGLFIHQISMLLPFIVLFKSIRHANS